jgi:hypothetical protein
MNAVLRDRCIEAAARAEADLTWPGWNMLSPAGQLKRRQHVAPLVDAVLREVADHTDPVGGGLPLDVFAAECRQDTP